MSKEQLEALLEAIKADGVLREKLRAAADRDAVVAIARTAGFVISAEELKTVRTEISDEELEGVTGGTGLLFGEVTVEAATMVVQSTAKMGLVCKAAGPGLD